MDGKCRWFRSRGPSVVKKDVMPFVSLLTSYHVFFFHPNFSDTFLFFSVLSDKNKSIFLEIIHTLFPSFCTLLPHLFTLSKPILNHYYYIMLFMHLFLIQLQGNNALPKLNKKSSASFY
ncbi:hypothetical protein V8G54_021018, partial [Vigna mungo]